MEAIILAGGLGTRLKSVVDNVPKPMAPICGRPFLEILLGHLARHQVTRAIMSVGHLAEVVIDHFGDQFLGIELAYVLEDIPLGTGGALAKALPYCRADHAFVLNGDTFLDLDLGEVERLWREQSKPVIVLRQVPDTARYGRVEVDSGRVTQFGEKSLPGPGKINAGCYLVPTDLLAQHTIDKPFSFEADFLADAVHVRDFAAFASDGLFIDIGIPEDFHRAQTMLRPYLL
jgi:D-glycero-alpha-D-manno-heptose 1-phosphate guanylyltransferase